jgi:TolB protein
MATASYASVIPPAPPRLGQISDLPAPLGGGGTIVFGSDREGTYDLYTMEAGDTSPTRLTDLPGGEYFPNAFPDGESILYYYVDMEDEEYPVQLRSINLDGTGDEMFVFGPIGGWSTFSPDGSTLIFTGLDSPTAACPNPCYSLVEYDLEADTFGPFPNDPDLLLYKNSSPAFSPDGSRIAIQSVLSVLTTSQIYLVDADGRNRIFLMWPAIGETKSELGPSWSPDGKQIAFSYGNDDETQLYVVNADGTNLRQVTNEPGTYNEAPDWSPDGSLIIFWSNRTGNKDVFITTLDGSLVVNLTNSPSNDEDGIWIK